MDKYIVPTINTLALFPLSVFYGMDHPLYLDVFIELNEDRTPFTKLIANAIIQKNHQDPESFREMIYMQLGYMGIDPEETTFYDNVTTLVKYICSKCSGKILGLNTSLIDVEEDCEWVNVLYQDQLEPFKCTQPQNVLTSWLGTQVTTQPVSCTTTFMGNQLGMR